MKHFLFLLLMLLSAQTFAQRTLTGQVSDTEGEPLIGVNILVKDTDAGTITDFDGNFSLRIPEGGEILVFSYIGYATKEVVIGTQTRIDIEMSTDAEALEEVIVVGYGTKKKRDVIGSVATVKSENITKLKSTSFVDGLQGQASGVQVVANSGVPGAPSTVKIRGISSISINTDPLWIVDGMPIYSGGNLGGTNGATAQDPMSLINPNDIESIQVLKDAAATAIYGSRGSNGVIIITTKSGKEGKGSITLDYSTGITEPSRNEQDIGF
ncbi:MAG: TonB-dependent receptor plug domain-containing protein, partial [Mameliella sp.]|nr:TonB-dependent receptor plug domain-containing protein [Phaeodactylibacter sp.]